MKHVFQLVTQYLSSNVFTIVPILHSIDGNVFVIVMIQTIIFRKLDDPHRHYPNIHYVVGKPVTQGYELQ